MTARRSPCALGGSKTCRVWGHTKGQGADATTAVTEGVTEGWSQHPGREVPVGAPGLGAARRPPGEAGGALPWRMVLGEPGSWGGDHPHQLGHFK